MQGMHFIQVQQVKQGKNFTYIVKSRGFVEGQIGQEEWAVRITGQPPVTYVRILRTAQLRDFALFDTEEDLIAFGQANWPNLFPPPAPPAAPEPPAPPADAGAPLDQDGTPTTVDYDNDCAP